MDKLGIKPHQLRIHAERHYRANGVALHLVRDDGAAVFQVAQPLVMAPAEVSEITAPFAVLPRDVAQQLIDELWNAGLRPTDGHGSAGQLAATQAHLADMKTLAFHALQVPRV